MIHDAPRAGLLHQQRALLAAEKRGLQIHVVDEVPIGFGDLERIASAESRGVVHQAVERARTALRPRETCARSRRPFRDPPGTAAPIRIPRRWRALPSPTCRSGWLRDRPLDASRSAIPRPMRLAAPVTSTVRLSSMRLRPPDLRALRLLRAPRLRAPARAAGRSSWPTAQKNAVVELSTPGHRRRSCADSKFAKRLRRPPSKASWWTMPSSPWSQTRGREIRWRRGAAVATCSAPN